MYGSGGHYDGGTGGGGGGAGNANSLFGGGGFMPSQSTNAPESSGGGGFPKTRNAQTLLPLTVKQMMDATQTSDDKSNYAVNGIEVSTVRLVGRMLNKLDRVTDVSFTLDDGTGRIQVIRWENDTTDTKEMADIKDGDYVIVNGGLKGFQGKRQVVAYSVRPVTNFNDVTHHFLHCIHVHLELTRSKPQVNANTAAVTPNQVLPRNGMTLNQVPLQTNQASGNSTGSKLSQMVLAYLSSPTIIRIDIGITPDQIKRDLNLSEDLVNAALKELLGEGTVYATIDDTHYKSVMNG